MKNTKLVATLGAVALVAAVGLGSTLAYLSDTAGPVQNTFTMAIRMAVRTPVTLLFAVTMTFVISWKLALLVLATIPVLSTALILLARKVFPIFAQIFKKVDRMNNTVQENIFYGSKATNPAGFDGLSVRYNKISSDVNSIGYRVINGGGTGSTNTSIWFVTWGDLHTHLLYPKGSQMGFVHTDKGAQTATDANGNMYEVYRDHFKWDVGMTVRDFRSTARIANIDVTKLGTANAADLISLMINAYHRIKRFAKTGNTVIYCNETIETYLHLQALNKANVQLSIEDFGGKPIVSFLGVPIKCVDQLKNDEAKVS